MRLMGETRLMVESHGWEYERLGDKSHLILEPNLSTQRGQQI